MGQLCNCKRTYHDTGDEKKVNETLLIVAILSGVVFIMILYIAIKDKEVSRKLVMIEASIDGLNREIFKISKELQTIEKSLLEKHKDSLEVQENGESIDKSINKKLKPFLYRLEHMQEKIDELSQFQEKLDRLDMKMRQVVFANEHAAPDEQKILQLYAKGMDSESIAKKLRLGKGEVELVLKFSKLNRV